MPVVLANLHRKPDTRSGMRHCRRPINRGGMDQFGMVSLVWAVPVLCVIVTAVVVAGFCD